MSARLTYTVWLGDSRRLERTISWARALRVLLEHSGNLAEVGYARIERSDGKTVARIDLDRGVP